MKTTYRIEAASFGWVIYEEKYLNDERIYSAVYKRFDNYNEAFNTLKQLQNEGSN